MLLIPLYLTGVISLFPFPHPLFPFTIVFLTTLLLLNLKMTTPFAQYVDGMMGDRPILNQPLHLVGFFLMTYLASHTDGNLLEPDLRRH